MFGFESVLLRLVLVSKLKGKRIRRGGPAADFGKEMLGDSLLCWGLVRERIRKKKEGREGKGRIDDIPCSLA